MTFGLLSSMYNQYRIQNETKEGFRPKQQMSIPAIGTVLILEIVLSIVAILCLIDVAFVENWNTWILVLILALYFIPTIGDMLAIIIICYWILQVRDRSLLLAKRF